ncbi:MAG: TadE family protein [Bryobacteraceae bacterium]
MRRSRCSRRASAFVEFAFGLTVLSPVLAGAAQYGWSLYQLHELEAAVEQGAEAGCLAPSLDGKSTWEETIRKATLARGSKVGLQPEQVQVRIDFEAREFEVAIHRFTIPVPLSPLVLNGKPSARFPICHE